MNSNQKNKFVLIFLVISALIGANLRAMTTDCQKFKKALKSGNHASIASFLDIYSTTKPLDDEGNTILHILFKHSPSPDKSVVKRILPYAGEGWGVKNNDGYLPLDLFQPKNKHASIENIVLWSSYIYLEAIHNKHSVTQWPRYENKKKQYECIRTFLMTNNSSNAKQQSIKKIINTFNHAALESYIRYYPDSIVDEETNRNMLHLLFYRTLLPHETNDFTKMFKKIMPYMHLELLKQKDIYGKLPLDYFDPKEKHADIKNLVINLCYEYVNQKYNDIHLDNEVRFHGASKLELICHFLTTNN